MAWNELFSSNNVARATVPKIIFLLTDGDSSDDPLPIANLMRAEDVHIIPIGIGNGVKKDQLKNIGNGTMYEFSNWSDLQNVTRIYSLKSKVCTSIGKYNLMFCM